VQRLAEAHARVRQQRALAPTGVTNNPFLVAVVTSVFAAPQVLATIVVLSSVNGHIWCVGWAGRGARGGCGAAG
jgi:glucose uptake protein GlcU